MGRTWSPSAATSPSAPRRPVPRRPRLPRPHRGPPDHRPRQPRRPALQRPRPLRLPAARLHEPHHARPPPYVRRRRARRGGSRTRPARFTWKDGRISPRQIERLRRFTAASRRRRTKILVVHHPFIPPVADPTAALVGRAQVALKMLEACGGALILAGHLHLAYAGDVRPHHVEIEQSILVIQAGTAISHRRRNEPNAYNLLTIDKNQLRLEVRPPDRPRIRPPRCDQLSPSPPRLDPRERGRALAAHLAPRLARCASPPQQRVGQSTAPHYLQEFLDCFLATRRLNISGWPSPSRAPPDPRRPHSATGSTHHAVLPSPSRRPARRTHALGLQETVDRAVNRIATRIVELRPNSTPSCRRAPRVPRCSWPPGISASSTRASTPSTAGGSPEALLHRGNPQPLRPDRRPGSP